MIGELIIKRPITNPAVIDYAREIVRRSDNPDNFYTFATLLGEAGTDADRSEVFEYLKKAADKGHADATSSLGDCYFYGHGTEKDQKKGVDCYILAAELGSLSGCFSAGNELLLGKIVKPDHPTAYRYLKKAADHGDERAMNSLGIMYLYGLYVPKDLHKAKKLFKKSSALGN